MQGMRSNIELKIYFLYNNNNLFLSSVCENWYYETTRHSIAQFTA